MLGDRRPRSDPEKAETIRNHGPPPSESAASHGAKRSGMARARQTDAVIEHGLSQQAVELARPLGFPITNSMVVTWIVAAGVILFARRATRSMHAVPDGSQNLLEWLIESLYNFRGQEKTAKRS